jgi:hypothetical protein
MKIIRGTTPTITINVKSDIDLTKVAESWVYIAQNKRVAVDKKIEDVTIDANAHTMKVTLTQDDTLGLKEGSAYFQIRLLMTNGTALACIAKSISIIEVYKGGVISE